MKKLLTAFLLLALLVPSLTLIAPNVALAQMVDSLDSYSDGDWAGNGTWTGSATWDIQGTVVQGGTKAAVHSGATGTEIDGTFTLAASDTQCLYGRTANNSISDLWTFDLAEGAQPVIRTRISGGQLQYFDGATYNNLGAISNDTWFKLEIQWQASDDTARYQLDDGGYTAYDTIWSAITTGVDTLSPSKDANNAAAVYFDTFTDCTAAPAAAAAKSILQLVKAFWIF